MNQLKLSASLELIGWLITSIIIVLVLLPIPSFWDGYPFLMTNIMFVVIFITYTRYIFFLKHTFIANWLPAKIFLIVLSIPLIPYLISNIHSIQAFMDEEGLIAVFEYMQQKMSFEKQRQLATYIRSELFLFGTASVIVCFMMPIRMLVSIWHNLNRKIT